MPEIMDGLAIAFEQDVPLGPLTWYGVGGPAKILAHPASVQQLAALAARCHERGVPTFVLGSGANLLVLDQGVNGVVVRLDDPAFKQLAIDGQIVTAGSGYDLARLVLDAARAGLAGIEALAGIPATVGGAVRMNAGGAFGDTGRAVRRVQVMDATGQVYYRDRDDLVFTYRKSNITAPFILDVEFELTTDDPDEVGKRVKEVFLFKKNSQPLKENSAGCAFKNHQPRPAAETDGPPERISAGKLIDQAGLKGFRIGGAEVSEVHANFIVAHPGAKAQEVLDVMNHVQQTVEEQTGIRLEREVVVWP